MSTPAVEEILGQLPLDQLASRFGVDPQAVAQAAAATIPSLIGGLQHNADQGGEQEIAGALAQHSSSPLLDAGAVDLNSVDTEDGAKIVGHIFGDQSTQLAHAIGQRTGASGGLVNQLLPVLAPIVMAYLAKRVTGQGGGVGGGMLGSLLGGILSGGDLSSILSSGETSQAPVPGDAQDGSDGSLPTGDTPGASPTGEPQPPQTSSSIVDEILGGLFGKR